MHHKKCRVNISVFLTPTPVLLAIQILFGYRKINPQPKGLVYGPQIQDSLVIENNPDS